MKHIPKTHTEAGPCSPPLVEADSIPSQSKHKTSITLPLLVLALAGLSSTRAWSQAFTGRVTDQTGAIVPQASIVVHNVETNVDTKTAATGTGDYSIPYLKVGTYQIRASAPGFAETVRTGVTLEVGQTATVNFALQLGAASETVVVNAAAVVDFDKSDRGEVVENTRVTELPLNGRDPGMLSQLTAGATWSGALQWQRPFDDTQANLSINGGGAGNTALLMDGVTNESPRGNGSIGYVPPVDAVQEFRIVANPYDAQYGRAQGGVEDVVLKSGTNRLHGDVYEYARRSWLDADLWSNDYYRSQGQNIAKPKHTQDQYGAELDGPVFVPKVYDGRNKSFFVLQYERWKEVVPNTITESVPDPAWINGDFSNLQYWTGSQLAPMTIYDPLTLHADAKGNLVRDPFPGNIIPASRINPTAKAVLSLYPKPNVTPPAGQNPFANNYEVAVPTTDNYRNVLAKWDEVFGPNDRFNLRFGYWERQEIRSNNGFTGAAAEGALPHGERSETYATDYTHTFTPKLVFDVRGTVNVRVDFWHDGPQGFDTSTIGFSPALIAQLGQGANHLPSFTPNEFTSIGNGGPSEEVHNLLGLLPTISWTKGKHSIHSGLDLRLAQNASVQNGQGPTFWTDRWWTQSNYQEGQWNVYSGNSVASMETGTFSNGSTNIVPTNFMSYHYYAPFVQDDWKVTPKLTLNLGARWDLSTPQTERHNKQQYVFNTTAVNPVNSMINRAVAPGLGPIKGGITYAGVNGNPTTPYSLYLGAIQPRVGFAYALDNRTVLRGGYGIMFRNSEPTNGMYGFSASTSYVATNDGGKTPLMNASNPFPTVVQPTGASLGLMTGIGNGFSFVNPHYKQPGFMTYSFGFERQFLKADTLEVSYAGSHTYNNDTSYNINPWPLAAYQACNVYAGGNEDLCSNSSNWAANPFYNVAAFNGTGYYSASTIQQGNLARPFPAFGDITETNMNTGASTYNALQVTAVHRINGGLTLHGTYTWAKQMMSGGWTDQVYGIPYRALDPNTPPTRVTISGVYFLPVGRGRQFLGKTNRIVDGAIGGWELGSLYIYQTGAPWAVPGGYDWVGPSYVPRHTTADNLTIVGVRACTQTTANDGSHSWVQSVDGKGKIPLPVCNNTPDFVQRPGYAPGQNVTYSGIRLNPSHQFDVNFSKNFAIAEGINLQTRIEGFNVLNHPLFQQQFDNNPQNSTFGEVFKPGGQSNLPRQIQLSAKVYW